MPKVPSRQEIEEFYDSENGRERNKDRIDFSPPAV